jgi:hypothetical protein
MVDEIEDDRDTSYIPSGGVRLLIDLESSELILEIGCNNGVLSRLRNKN